MGIPAHEYGKYGGRVLRAFKADVPFVVDAEITPQMASTWPMSNRKALFETGKIEWYGPPEDAEKRTVAAAASATPAKKKEEKVSKTPAVRKSSRTK